MNILGDTLEQIAAEKAGIIKSRVPIVIGEAEGEVRNIFIEKAKAMDAPITFANEAFHAIDWQYKHHELVVEVAKNKTEEKNFYHLDLPGIYQTKNLLTTICAVHELEKKGFVLYDSQIKNGLRNTKKQTGLHGRWELIHEHPPVIVDVAHNADGISQLLKQLELIEPKHLHIVIGVVKDKDVNQLLSLLPKYANYYFTEAQIPRALPSQQLHEAARDYELTGESFSEVNSAVKAAMSNASNEDLVLVCGSVFVVGEVAV
jgi:dihydrofolate synthase/folylpolyglutamate synthase